jgi:hypothetical protein
VKTLRRRNHLTSSKALSFGTKKFEWKTLLAGLKTTLPDGKKGVIIEDPQYIVHVSFAFK